MKRSCNRFILSFNFTVFIFKNILLSFKIQVSLHLYPTVRKGHMTTAHVYRKFPNHIEAIQELLWEDDTFREIYADSEEIRTWVDDYCHSQSRPSQECDAARDLIRDLEDEINQKLRNAGFCRP